LKDYHYSPWSARWRNWNWAREARRLLGEAAKGLKKQAQMQNNQR
jgi:hypothetical protein